MAIVKKGFFWLATVLVLLALNFPIIIDISTAFKPDNVINSFPPKFLFPLTMEHFKNVFYGSGYPFGSFFLNSVMVSIGASILAVLVCVPAAYAMVNLDFGVKRFFPFVVSLKLLPPIVFAIPFFIMFQFLGLLDSIAGLILIGALMGIPLVLMLSVAFIQELSREIIEAGMIDGLSNYSLLYKIILPLIAPGISAAMVLTYIFTWNEFLFVRILSDQKAMTATVGSTLFVQAYGIKWGDISAAVAISILIPLVVTRFVQRYLVTGLSMGAVKG